MNRMLATLTSAAVIAFTFGTGLLAEDATAGAAPTGADNWGTHCKKCHGADGSGNTVMGSG